MVSKGQLSVEMMVVLVIILGLAVVVANAMLKSAGKASEKVEQKTDSILAASDQGVPKGADGDYCASGADCSSGSCNQYTNKCE
ncbi:MAG: hypothetical protein WC588_05350 [Candidatus Micrarchaeia archaeon]